MNTLERYFFYANQGLGGDVGATLTLADALNEFTPGEIVLANGSQTVFVPVWKPVDKVYLALEPGPLSGCGLTGNLARADIVPGGFNLVADIQSSYCVVSYLVA